MDRAGIVREMVASSRQMLEGANDGRPANFEGADLAGIAFAKLYEGAAPGAELYLGLANFRKADLRNADLSGCPLYHADFTGANLEGAKLSGAALNGAKLIDARLINTDLSRALAYGVEIEGALLQGVKLKGLKGDTKFEGSAPASPAKIKGAVIAAAKDAAESTELEGLSASDADGLQEAAEDLWHHSGLPDLEAQFDDEESSALIHGDAMWKLFQKTAVEALKARLKGGGGGKKAKNVVAAKKGAKAAPSQKAAPRKTPKKKPSTKKGGGRARAR